MNIEQVVRVVEVRGSVQGMDQVARAYDQVSASSERNSKSLNDNGKASVDVEAALDRLSAQLQDTMRQQQQYTDAMAQQSRVIQQSARTNDNYTESSSRLGAATRFAAKAAVEHAAAHAAAAAKTAVLTLVLGAAATILGGLYVAYKVLKTAIDLVSDAWELGNAKLAEYVALGQKATIVSTDFYQRLQKSATDAKQPVDVLTESLKKLSDASAPKLGGSDAQNRINELTKAGNFQGNSGVGQFAAATTAEERFRAISALISEAMQKGERLAALDLSEKFLGAQVTAALTKDSEYLSNMLRDADRISQTSLVSAADVGRATELQARYDAATKILSDRWHPLQNLLTSAGIAMKAAWVSIVESIASAVDWASKLVDKLISFPYWARIKDGLSIMSTGYRVPEGPVYTDPKAYATDQLRAGLQNPNAVLQGRDQTNALSNALRPDTSFDPAKAKQITEVKDALERATDAVQKYILTTDAAARSVDAGVAEQEKAKVIAQLTAAAHRDGKTNLAQYAAEWDVLANRAGQAARELRLAQVQSQIKFDQQTMFLSPEDVKIATQLKGLFPDIAASLRSPEAAAMRFNDQIKAMGDLGRNSATQFTDDLAKGLASGQTAVESLHNAFKNLASSLTSGALKSLFQGDFLMAAVQGIAAIGAAIFSANTSSSGEKWLAAQKDAMATRNADYAGRISLAGVDTNTREGAILAQDQQFIRERIAENKAGGQAMNTLLQAELQERIQLQKDWDKRETDLVKANADAKLAIEKAAADRSLGYQNRLFAATNDFDTLEGQLVAFDRTAMQDRLTEIAAGGQAIVDLESAQAAERYNVIKNFNDKTLAALNSTARGITDYLNNLVAGSGSTQSPTATLASAQTLYQQNLGLAQAGNADAQAKFASLADQLEKAARVVYASGQGYQDIRNQIINQGLGLPSVQTTTDPVTQAVRDAITAIQIGNTALGAINTTAGGTTSAIGTLNTTAGGTTSAIGTLNTTAGGTTAALTNGILPAVNAGNAASVASALATYFNQIDPSGKLASIVNTNASLDGYTQAYLPNISGQSFNLPTIANNAAATKNAVDSNNTLTGASNSTLDAIKGLQTTANTQLTLLTNALSPVAVAVNIGTPSGNLGAPQSGGSNLPAGYLNNQVVTALNKIVYNTYAIASNTAYAASSAGGGLLHGHSGIGVYATGGLVTGPGSGTSDSIRAMLSNGEYVMTAQAVNRFGVGFFDQLSAGRTPVSVPSIPTFRGAGNDNSALIAALIKRIDQLEATLSNATIISGKQIERAVRDTSKDEIDAAEDDAKRLAFAITQNVKDNKAA